MLSDNAVMTFKDRRVYTSPTEVIPLSEITTVKSCDEDLEIPNTFVLFILCRKLLLEKFFMSRPIQPKKNNSGLGNWAKH